MGWDDVWDRIFANQEWGKYPSEALIRFVARNYYSSIRSTCRLLEVGCGPGGNLWFLAREGFDVYGIDGSRTAIEQARQRLEGESLSATLAIGEMSSLPYQDCFFDAVIDCHCLSHNSRSDALRILQEIRRVLKPGGKLFSRTFSEEMHVGSGQEKLGSWEFTNVSEGPLQGKGFVRLLPLPDVASLYSESLELESVDRLHCTLNDGAIVVGEWIVVARKGSVKTAIYAQGD